MNLLLSEVSGAVGVELWRTKKVGMSLEVGYDTSEIKVKYTASGDHNLPAGNYSDKVTCPGFTVGLSVVFGSGQFPFADTAYIPRREFLRAAGVWVPGTGFPQNCCHTGRTRQ